MTKIIGATLCTSTDATDLLRIYTILRGKFFWGDGGGGWWMSWGRHNKEVGLGGD